MSNNLGDVTTKTSPTWDTFAPGSISGTSYAVSASGFPVWRHVRCVTAGTLVFKCATPWAEQIPGGSFVVETGVLTKAFLAGEILEGVQVIEVIKAGSSGTYEVRP